MKDSHIIAGFVVLGAAVVNLYLSAPAPTSGQRIDPPASQASLSASEAAASEVAAPGTDCEGASSPLVAAVAPPCPVMNMKVTTRSFKSTHLGKTYYFCCADCKPKFDSNPAQYVDASAGSPYARM